MEKKIVPYFDSTRQYAEHREEFTRTVIAVLESGSFILGRWVQDFEKAFAQYCGQLYAVGVGSGTDALTFALKALGIGVGDEVLLPSFTFVATGFAILHAGAVPVFVDVDPKTYTMDPDAARKAVTRRTRAIIPVHIYGHMADMKALHEIAKAKKLMLIEDACQAHGAAQNGKKAGACSHAGCFSFYPTKNLGACGDGGMVVTNRADVVERVERLRNLGRRTSQGPHEEIGWTSRLDAIQSAILNVKLKYLDQFIEKRRQIANWYARGLAGTPILLPVELPGYRHVYHLYVIRVPQGKRDELRDRLTASGIPTLLHYPIPVHRQPPFKKILKRKVSLPVTERLTREIISLPIFPEMTEQEVDQVCDVIRKFYR
ncbi:MAG: DegT/DnrJ/EryC1/StrS family aminotransferase [Candidatus Omnitrophica bacterium]|nr:DegT/DnrJ/EryC1/StrS family aminotransferase [Candidatus Omnitrophota bacterium]